MLDYFDAFLFGLTATPDSRTFAVFNENVVSEYSHEDAVADGVNVPYDVYIAENRDRITAPGILYAEPYRRLELTYQMIRDLCDTIRQERPRLAPFIVWQEGLDPLLDDLNSRLLA